MNEVSTVEPELVAEARRAGIALREHGPYEVLIGNETMTFTARRIQDPIVTGAQILAAAGVLDGTHHLVLQLLVSGETEALRSSEVVDLRASGVERFVVFDTDRLFRLELETHVIDWGSKRISGRTLVLLAGRDPAEFEAWVDARGGEDRPLEPDETVSLETAEVERFVVRPISVLIYVNTRPKTLDKRQLTYMEVVKLGFPDGPFNENIVYTIDYMNGPPQNPEGQLVAGDSVYLKRGMRFNVTPTDKS